MVHSFMEEVRCTLGPIKRHLGYEWVYIDVALEVYNVDL